MKTMMPSNSKQQLGNGKTSKVSNYEKQMDDMSDEELRTWHRRHFGTSTCQVCGETFATPSQMYVHHGKAHYKPTPGIHSGV